MTEEHLGGRRYCPRCGEETIWTNLPERGETLRCTVRETRKQTGPDEWAADVAHGCGFELEMEPDLTEKQRERLLEHNRIDRGVNGLLTERSTLPPRRRYEFV